MVRIVSFADLSNADLVIDAIYQGAGGQLSGEPLSKLLPGMGNLGGFRTSGRGDNKKLVVLYTSGEHKDWPDRINVNTGQFVYYGDNKTPGHELHETRPGGNRILRHVFALLHSTPPDRERVPPFFVFKKYPTSISTLSVQFKGLAAPGFMGLPATDDLVAVWKTSEGQRFQNYQATFTILDAPVLNRAWLHDIQMGRSLTSNAPEAWSTWVRSGQYRALTAESTTVIRGKPAQIPDTDAKAAILDTVWKYFKDAPRAFEAFAARLFQLHDPRVMVDELTRPSVDGGRDAVGRYLLGLNDDPVYVEFSLEAKCYRPHSPNHSANSVGVNQVSRLISRIRHRQFGVLVTTSIISRRAYEEVREDGHPIIFLCGKDIADILTMRGYNTPKLVENLLQTEFNIPVSG